MSSTFNEQAFEQKLVNLKDTQEAIIGLSTWCLQNRDHHKQIVMCWLHCLKRVKIEVRLSLFYLANDVIQHSKRRRYDFVESWGTALQKATPLVRDDKVRERILRIFKIWEERQIYDEAFIADLCGLLTTKVKKKNQVEISNQTDFQPSMLVRKIKEIKALSENTDLKFKRIKDNKLPLTDAESMRLSLKDRRHGSDVSAEVDSGVKKMEAFVKALETEIGSREKLIDTLREALIFYEKQRGEAKIVANAYRNFGSRLRTQQKSVEELVNGMSSPLPSPDVNAPSPSPDSDFDTRISSHHSASNPVSNGDSNEFSLVNSSFIGSGHFFDISKEIFSSDSKPEQERDAEAQPIEVIGGREAGANFDVAEFFKSLIANKEPVLQPPPMPPVFTDWSTAGPWDQPPLETPLSPPMYEKQAPTHEQPLVYDDSLPMVPVEDEDHRTLLPPTGPPMELPLIDIDHRGPPPMNMDLHPPPMRSVDIDHRNMPMHAMDVPPPSLSERAAIIPPNADRPPAPVSLLGPPPPPPAMQALLDIDQRNLIRLTGPAGAARTETFHKEAVYIPPVADDYNTHRRNDQPHFNNAPPDGGGGSGGGGGGYEPVFPPCRDAWNQPEAAPRVNETWNQSREHEPWIQQREQEPRVNETWNQPSREEPRVNDNVESIDMDMSEGEDESQTRGGDYGRGRGFHMDRQPPPINQGAFLGPSAPLDVDHAHHFSGPPVHKELPVHEQPFHQNEPAHQQVDPHQHAQPPPLFGEHMHSAGAQPPPLFGEHMHSAGAKLVPHLTPNDENNFHNNGFADDSDYDNYVNMRPAPRWQSPRPPRGGGGQKFNRPQFNQRSPMFRPRQFRPRGRW